MSSVKYFSVGLILSIVVMGGLFYDLLPSLRYTVAAPDQQDADTAPVSQVIFDRVGVIASINRNAGVIVVEHRNLYDPPKTQMARIHIADDTVVEQRDVSTQGDIIYSIQNSSPSSLARLRPGMPVAFTARANQGVLEAVNIWHSNILF